MRQAQLRDHVSDKRVAKQHIARARVIMKQLDDPNGPAMPILRIQYEELIRDPQGEIDALLHFADADFSQAARIVQEMAIYDGNAQYYRVDEGANA